MRDVIKQDEKAVFALRSLYEGYGYSQYKMNKFEEYDLYLRNKDFLVSDHILTFTDTDGKLMALKPDVTLSIVKNGTDDVTSLQKVYYDENVYRVSRGSGSYREIMQVGLECIGNIDEYRIYEVLTLAAKSLAGISDDFVLDISHMGVITEVLDTLSLTLEERKRLLHAIGEKNTHDIADIPGAEKLQKLISAYGSSAKVKSALAELYPNGLSASAALLIRMADDLEAEFGAKIRIDFSVVNDYRYYSGIVFKGFISGIPTDILTGGQYDLLMKKMGRSANAIGFAVYLDLLEQLFPEEKPFDVDTAILYTPATPPTAVRRALDMAQDENKTAAAYVTLPEKLKYRYLIKLDEKGDAIDETNA